MWLQHGQQDPTRRTLIGRTAEDHDRIDAIQAKGGACGPCRRSKKRCDDSDYCRGCKHRGIPSQEAFLDTIQSTSYTSGLENISLYDLLSPARFNSGLIGFLDSDSVSRSQERVKNHVNSWFKKVTRMIDPKPFFGDFEREVSLSITSSSNGNQKTSFSLKEFDISSHLEQQAYPLCEDSLLDGFMGHANMKMPPAPRNGQPRSTCVRHLSWIVSNTFAFLKSFAEAEMYAPIKSMSTARATVSIIYASLYRLLLTKSDALCLFVLESLQQDFQYCTRSSRKDLIEDSLRGLAQYHRVVAGLAGLENSCPEAAALLSELTDRANVLLQDGSLKELFLRVYEKLKAGLAKQPRATTQPKLNDLMSSYSSKVPDIKSLSIAIRVNSGNDELPPVSTEAMRDTDPYHHFRPIKVRDLLKENDGLAVDPRQVYIDDFVGNFPNLRRTRLERPGPSVNCPNSFVDQELCGSGQGMLSTSMDPEHASLRPSQQDTETESIKSELTVQNDFGDILNEPVNTSPKDAEGYGWRNVPPGKGCKRRERSGDSQGSRHSSGHSGRKHFRLDSGRESPPPYNYFGPLTHEPAALR
jgi:hypothetical protein